MKKNMSSRDVMLGIRLILPFFYIGLEEILKECLEKLSKTFKEFFIEVVDELSRVAWVVMLKNGKIERFFVSVKIQELKEEWTKRMHKKGIEGHYGTFQCLVMLRIIN